MAMRLFLLPSTTGLVSMQRYVLADSSRNDVERELAAILAQSAAINPRFEWSDVVAALEMAGFVVPGDTWLIERPWDESRSPEPRNWLVAFPSDAPHEYAGKCLTATTAIPGEELPLLIDEHDQLLMASDRPWSASATPDSDIAGLLSPRSSEAALSPMLFRSQVPLGPVLLPRSQFHNETACAQAHELMREAGFDVQLC